MSVRLPPHVELIRLGTRKTLSGTSSTRPPAMIPQTCSFLPNATTSGRRPELLVGPRGAGHAAAGLHLVEHEQRVVRAAQLLHRLQELRAHVVVAALALDGLGDEAGDVVRVRRERGLGLRQRPLLGLGDGGRRSSIGKWIAGTSMRGQSNFGKRSVFTGSVLVSESV